MQGFGGVTQRKEQLGRPRSRWDEYIKKGLNKQDAIARTGLIWLSTGEKRHVVVNKVMKLRVLYNARIFID